MKPLHVRVEEEIQTAFGPKLCEALGVTDPKASEALTGIIHRHRAHLAKQGAATCSHTRMLADGHLLEIITETRLANGHPFTICGLSTEWTTLTGEAPPQRPGASN